MPPKHSPGSALTTQAAAPRAALYLAGTACCGSAVHAKELQRADGGEIGRAGR
jgi:hypothetical protein